ncbi:hypothetical protein BC827DRAFT_1156467 [Russula dissimulans]|nr:hypothetical protein BC827DRAFT_1156467 [Russula dissimulans]
MGEEQSGNSEQDKALAVPLSASHTLITKSGEKEGTTKSERSVQVISGPIEEVDAVEETPRGAGRATQVAHGLVEGVTKEVAEARRARGRRGKKPKHKQEEDKEEIEVWIDEILRDKNIEFVHFMSISIATKVVNTLPTEPAWGIRCSWECEQDRVPWQHSSGYDNGGSVERDSWWGVAEDAVRYMQDKDIAYQFVTFIDPAALSSTWRHTKA